MKRIMLIAFFVMLSGYFGIQPALAQKEGPCPGDCRHGKQNSRIMKGEANDKFLAETRELRKEITAVEDQLQGIMRSEDPDFDRAGKLAGQLFELRKKMHTKKAEYGLDRFCCRGGKGCRKEGGEDRDKKACSNCASDCNCRI